MYKKELFSKRELEVIHRLLKGESNKQIASVLGVSVSTIEFHLGNIYTKLGVSSRAETIIQLSENHHWESIDECEQNDSWESIVENVSESGENGKQSILHKRIPLKSIFYILGTILLIIALVVVINLTTIFPATSHSTTPQVIISLATLTSNPTVAATAMEPGHTTGQIPTTYTNMIGSYTVSLSLKWFYIDSSRVYMEFTVSGFPLPEGVIPTNIVDPQNIVLHKADGSAIAFGRSGDMWGGGGGEDNSSKESPQSFDVFLDAPLEDSNPVISQDETYIVDVPVGGEVNDEDGSTLSLSTIIFHIEVKPFYIGPLTFVTQKAATIEDKTMILRELEINPSLSHVVLCVFDPEGSQWVPTVHLLYKGNIYNINNGWGLTGSNENSEKGELCYRMSYSFPFDATGDPKKEIALWVEKVIKDEPEILPPDLIVHALNQLSEQGIEFKYVIANHSTEIVITKKPETMTDEEAKILVQKALTEEADASGVLILDFI
jgi:DNA-binding CsgD family transcriptional regulator